MLHQGLVLVHPRAEKETNNIEVEPNISFPHTKWVS